MAFLQVHFASAALGKQVQVNVVLPQLPYKKDRGELSSYTYPTLYLLHGASDDNTMWERRTSIERYASDRGIAVVMPNADLSWYCDMKTGGGNYFTYISEELPAVCREFFPHMSTKREETFIAGLSMGGYGATKIALRHPETFSHVITLSGALDLTYAFNRHQRHAIDIFGETESAFGGEDDVFALAERFPKDGSQIMPKFFAWCGTEDSFITDNRRFREVLENNGFDVTYYESEGTHSWEYWDKWILKGLEWLPINK